MDFGTWGFNPESVDETVDPGDDFNAYANGEWIKENPIPAEYARFGAFNILGEKSTADVEKLVADLVASNPAPGTVERRLVDAYQAFENTAVIEAAALSRPHFRCGHARGSDRGLRASGHSLAGRARRYGR
jgi:putative endopeptidase